jgi:hypothetical protein
MNSPDAVAGRGDGGRRADRRHDIVVEKITPAEPGVRTHITSHCFHSAGLS